MARLAKLRPCCSRRGSITVWTHWYSISYAAGSRGGPQACQRPPSANDEVITTQISLRGAYGNLHRRRGAGMTSGRNEYLRALAISHDDRRADTAIAEHERFVLRVNAAGDLPAWFFLVWSSCNLTPLSYMPKPAGRTPAETPPRPIVVGEPTQRGFATALTKAGTETYKEYLMPQQLAIGVSDAAGQLVHGFRA